MQANGASSTLEKGGFAQPQGYLVEKKRPDSTSHSPIGELALARGSAPTPTVLTALSLAPAAPSSQKSTVLKQAKLINHSGYNSAERNWCEGLVFSSIP